MEVAKEKNHLPALIKKGEIKWILKVTIIKDNIITALSQLSERAAVQDISCSRIMINHVCIACLYLVFLLCIFLNLYVLLSRANTLFNLRVYHSAICVIMVCCLIVQLEFMIRTRKLPKLEEPHEIPGPALVGAIALTLGICLGYLYFVIFNYAYIHCDKLVDTVFSESELYLEAIYDVLMAIFSAFSLIYILQRRYYGAINSNLDKIGRLFINLTIIVVWIKVVVYKAYTSHQELCQRKELEGYWCPVMKRKYNCNPAYDLHGTQKMWYYINKGLLSSAIVSCASEFFPVLLVAHWLACGGAEERAEDIMKRQQRKEGLKGLMREFIKDVSRVYVEHHKIEAPPLKISSVFIKVFWIVAPLTAFMGGVRWLTFFFYSINFDELEHEHWQTSNIMTLIACLLQLVFFGTLYYFVFHLADERLDAHHKAHARGDIGLLFGCCFVLLVKFLLQGTEMEYQRSDGFTTQTDAVMGIISLALTHFELLTRLTYECNSSLGAKYLLLLCLQLTQWLQYLSLRRLLSISSKDLIACRGFLPLVTVVGLILAWVHFGCTYLDTTLIKYQLTDETFRFTPVTLICMIFTQTMFPADYLFAFTASGCYLELIQRYMSFGVFQLGDPHIGGSRSGSVVEIIESRPLRFTAGQNIATMIETGRILQRKQATDDEDEDISTNGTATVEIGRF